MHNNFFACPNSTHFAPALFSSIILTEVFGLIQEACSLCYQTPMQIIKKAR